MRCRIDDPLPWLQAFLLVLAVALAAGCARDPKLPRLGSDDVVLAFGDSLTYGTGAEVEQSYPSVLARQIGRRVVREGVPGETSQAGLERLPYALERHRPSLVILCLGGNDFLRRIDEASTRANLRAMLSLLADQRIPVLLIGVPKAFVATRAAPLYEELAEEFRAPIERRVLGDVLTDRTLKSDPIHPNAAGYARIAEAVSALLQRTGAI